VVSVVICQLLSRSVWLLLFHVGLVIWLLSFLCELCQRRQLYTVFRKKNIHSCFLLYLHGKCFDFHKVFKGIVCITPVEKVDIFCYW